MQSETKSKAPLRVGLGPAGLLAALIIGVPVFVPLILSPMITDLWSIVLLIGATLVYVAFAISKDHSKLLGTIIQAGLAIGLVALAAVFGAQWIVVLGLLGHAVWDGFHLSKDQHHVPWWYAGACIYVDLIAAAVLFIK